MSRRAKKQVLMLQGEELDRSSSISELDAEISRRTSELRMIKEDYVSTRKALLDLQEALEKTKTEKEGLDRRLKLVGSSYQTLYSEFTQYQKDVNLAREQSEDSLRQLKALIEADSAVLSMNEAILTKQEEKLVSYEKDSARLLADISEKKAELSAMVSEASSKIREKELSANQLIERLEQERVDYVATLAKLESETETATEDLKLAKENLTKKKQEVEYVADILLKKKNEVRLLDSELSEIKKSITEFSTEYAKQKQLSAQLEVKQSKLDEYAKLLKDKYGYLGINVDVNL